MNFLAKGHTHEDLDRKFSVVSKHLTNKNIITQECLVGLLRGIKSLQAQVVVLKPSNIVDFKRWIEGHIKNIDNITKARSFFVRSIENETRFWYRPTMASVAEWEPSPGLKILKSTPTTIPSRIVRRSLDTKQLSETFKQIKDRFSDEQKNIWKDMIESEVKDNLARCAVCVDLRIREQQLGICL